MRKILFSSLFVIFSLIVVLLLGTSLPKYSGMMLFFFLFLLFDGYLWLSVNKAIRKLSPVIRALATGLFWLPVALLPCLMIYGFLVPFTEWNPPFRTYLQSFILMLFLSEFFPGLTLALADILRLGTYIVLLLIPGQHPSLKSIPRFRPLLLSGWITGALLFAVLLAGTAFWQFDFRVRKVTIPLKDLPQSFDGLKIVQFSDVHLGSWGSEQRLREALQLINGLHPDVIFFTGDMFNYCTADGNGFQEDLKTLKAPLGIYAIMGNHDYGDYISWRSPAAKAQNLADLKIFYKNLGWKLLLNEHDILKRGIDSIAIIGVENWGATARFQRVGDVEKAQRNTEAMAVQLLLSHDPSHWDSIVSKKYPNIDVTFSGHTHGGQVGIDLCNIHWSPVKWVSRLWCGLYKNPGPGPDQYLYVNQGLGNIGYAGRVGILPEITQMTLKKAKKR